MKKNFVFALASLSLVAVARGATVEWSSGDLGLSALDSIKEVRAYYYLMDKTAGQIAYDGGNGTYTTSDLLEIVDGKWTGDLATAYAGATELAGPITDSTSPFEDGLTYTEDNIEEDRYVIAVYEAISDFGGSYVVANIGYFQYNDGGFNGGVGGDSRTTSLGSEALDYQSSLTGGTGWTAVPEPTTVALLALGLAAVGLKRKVA